MLSGCVEAGQLWRVGVWKRAALASSPGTDRRLGIRANVLHLSTTKAAVVSMEDRTHISPLIPTSEHPKMKLSHPAQKPR